MLAAEIEAEFDNAIPIVENIRQVHEGDLIISDMYLPHDVLRRMLAHIGLRQHVHLIVSNLGKNLGWIWRDIASQWIVCRHMGDDAHSDVATPRLHGVPTTHFSGANLSQFETLVGDHGYPLIAGLMRNLRLRNPFEPGSQQFELWLLTCQLNVPLLIIFSQLVREKRDAYGARKILFSARDCYFLSSIFSILFPSEPSDYIYVSREMLQAGGEDARNYLVERSLEESLVCDIAATGSSWYIFTEQQKIPVKLITLVHIDNWASARIPAETIRASRYLTMESACRSSSLRNYTTAIEVLNPAPHGTCHGMIPAGQIYVTSLMTKKNCYLRQSPPCWNAILR